MAIRAGAEQWISRPARDLALIAFPWIIVRSLRFNARMTSWRNVRFDFAGDYVGALMAFVVWPFLGIFLGLIVGGIVFSFGGLQAAIGAGAIVAVVGMLALAPLAAHRAQAFIVNNARFGGKPFKASFGVLTFYRIFILATIVLALLFVQFAVFGGMEIFITGLPGPGFIVSYFILLIGAVFVGVYIQTTVTNVTFNQTELEGGHGFRSLMSPWVRLWIALSNTLMIVFTLGLLYPWARIRLARYRGTQTAVLAASDLAEFTSDLADQNAIGEQLGEVFDVEISI